jgi:hypothetical protein
MKYAILSPADQTIVYETSDNPDSSWTTKHSEAKLWDSKELCEAHCAKLNKEFFDFQESRTDLPTLGEYIIKNNPDREWYIVEEVSDEQEFRSRKDTW